VTGERAAVAAAAAAVHGVKFFGIKKKRFLFFFVLRSLRSFVFCFAILCIYISN
jgi:hypothetical protein